MTAGASPESIPSEAPNGARAATAPGAARRWSVGRLELFVLLLVLLLMAARLEHAAWVKTITVDEILHIGQGVALVQQGDTRLQPENGMLTQRLVGWAVQLGAGTSVPTLPATLGMNQRWTFVQQVLYGGGDDPRRLVWAARQVSILCGLGLGLLVWGWSRRLWGASGALLSLLLVTLSPDVLAHAALANSDAPFWFAGMLALALGWRLLSRPDASTVIGAGLALGVALTSKFSALLLPPVLGLLWLWRALAPRGPVSSQAAARDAAVTLGALMLAGVVAFATLWAVYGFRFAAGPRLGAELDWAWLPAGPSAPVSWLREAQWLPESFLWGLQHVLMSTSARLNFFAGEISSQGSLAYFPLALAWKTPVGTLILWGAMLVAGLAAWRRQRGSPLPLAPLLVFSAAYLIAALTSQLNIGVRHVIPAVLPWFVLAGSLPRTLPSGRGWIAPAMLLLVAVESLAIHPHHLAFFNLAAGGPARGHRLLVDSNLDWGQDLDALVAYSRRLPAGEPLHYAYFGTASPRRHGLRGVVLKNVGSRENPVSPLELQPGVYAISATLLPNLYEFPELRGAWRTELEPRYRALRARTATGAASADEIQWYNRMVFARLAQVLRARRPDDTVNYSILVYRLDRAAVDAVRDGPLPP
jgi:hypothetical protein